MFSFCVVEPNDESGANVDASVIKCLLILVLTNLSSKHDHTPLVQSQASAVCTSFPVLLIFYLCQFNTVSFLGQLMFLVCQTSLDWLIYYCYHTLMYDLFCFTLENVEGKPSKIQ